MIATRFIHKLLILLESSLLRNSIYLMLGTAVLSGFGFFFWLISAKLVPADTVGLATTLVSVLNMITVLALVGFDTTVVRFLPQSKARNDILNTGMALVALAALVLGATFVLLVPFVSAQLEPLLDRPLFAALFLLFCTFCSLNLFTGAAFIAFRESGFTLASNTFFSVLKILLPFAFIGWGAFGIFAAAAAAQSTGFAFNIYVLMRRFDYRPRFEVSLTTLKQVWRYSLGNYAAGTLNLLPMTLLPILITNHLGPASAAYFYIIMMIGSLLYMIPASTSRSLLAEGSHNDDDAALMAHTVRSAYTVAFFLLPAIAVLFVGGKYILLIFGPAYAANGIGFLYLIALSSLAVAIYSLYSSLLRIKHNVRALVTINLAYALFTIGGSYLFLRFGLIGIGFVWIGGNMLAAASSYTWYQLSGETLLAEKIGDFRSLILPSKLSYARARLRGGRQKSILCYPEAPQFFHTLYMVIHRLGHRISTDPSAPFDRTIIFEDATKRRETAAMQELLKKYAVINERCADISKMHVDRVFTEIFGYSSFVDPRAHHGICVKKSDDNAMHDGEIIPCPAEPQVGYVYQKLIVSENAAGEPFDLRVPYFKGLIPFVCRRFHAADDRFDAITRVELVPLEDAFSAAEIELVHRFCSTFGLEYGELDTLRDKDGLLYIVDTNTTPAGPRAGHGMSAQEFEIFIRGLAEAFTKAFLD